MATDRDRWKKIRHEPLLLEREIESIDHDIGAQRIYCLMSDFEYPGMLTS